MRKEVIYAAIILAVAITAVYFSFFYAKKCYIKDCFDASLEKCKKASFINDAEDASWLYKIKGKSDGYCEINVKLLQLKQGSNELSQLEGKSMDCYLPYVFVSKPEENLEKCSGQLKEEMQKIIINRLHKYIRENLGTISEEMKKAI